MSDLPEGESELSVSPCECGDKNCNSIVFGVRNPHIVPVVIVDENGEEATDELAVKVHFPIDQIPNLIDHLKELYVALAR